MNKKAALFFYYLFIIHSYFFVGCKGRNEDHQQQAGQDTLKEHLVNVNKIMVDNEASRIEEFIKRHQWKMDSTATGVRYWIYSKGDGMIPRGGEKVKVSYRLFLLDGSQVNQSEGDKPIEFTLWQGENTRGLEEALMLMHAGSKAWVIVPKYLGYGMTGDGKKIPGNSTLLYDVELLSVN